MEATSSASMPYANRDATTRKRKRTTPSTKCYQVFINHRGPDVKKTLGSIIYHCLQGKGVQVFLDKDEFQPGQPLKSTIEEAIWASSVHLAIFSKRYAESNWCLDELCLMLETETPIIPVFYDVSPNDLRWIEKGQYASAFAEHEKKGRFDSQTISAWKLALKQVAGISGLDLHDSDKIKGDWGQLLKSVEDAVFQNLKPVPLEVATDPVGLDEIIDDFESYMESEQQNENKKVKIVGIVGLGESGKTTLAKEFFNRQSPSFESSSFLFDLRDASNRNKLTGLQGKLLQDLHMGVRKINSVSEGREIIREKLRSSTPTPRVLIVLDDIDHPSQVEALLAKDLLGSGSLIIITSRDKEALKLSEASVYKIKSLGIEKAQNLFCNHAFQQPYPMGGFEGLVKRFCEKCEGLPLFLKVMGAHLRVNAGNDMEMWEDELKHIPKDILNILYVSYNALSNEEKQIFLDIACFFLGEDKYLAIKVWDKCEGRGLLRLNILANKCLVEFDSGNYFKMHDHVRDFGREIANKESPCRLWNETQAANLCEPRKASKEFRGIMATTCDYIQRRYCNRENYRILTCKSSYEPPLKEIELSALKILVIYGDCFDVQLGEKLKNLAWLRWVKCSYTNISPWLISMKSLTVLELLGEGIEEWPLRGRQVHLRELRIVGTNLSMISISQYVCPRLEYLDLSYNLKLKEIKHLPQKLVKLNLRGCENLEELQGLEHLPQLRDLDISRCFSLSEVPKLQHLLSLEVLNAYLCWNLKHIQGLEHLSKLRNVDISCCFELCELPKLQHLPSLEELSVCNFAKLQHIQGLEHLPRLRNLNISCCSELCELPKLLYLPSLEELSIYDCAKLQHIQGLEHLPKLQIVDISCCSDLRELPKLQHLPSLEELSVSDCAKLQHISRLEHLPKLQNLNISCCSDLSELPKLQHLSSLEELSVSDCAKLQHLQGLEHLPKLRNVFISCCFELRELPKLQQLPSLERLCVGNCAKLQHIQGLEDLPQLRELSISECPELQEFPNLAHLISLEKVKADGCPKLHDIQGLDQPEKLKSLTLAAVDHKAIWNVMEQLKKLPRRVRLRARAEVNSVNNENPPIIDSNIHQNVQVWELPRWAVTELNIGSVHEWKLGAWVEEDDHPPTCLMVCFVVQFPTVVQSLGYFAVAVDDQNCQEEEWRTRVEEGEWVYAVIYSNSMDGLHTVTFGTEVEMPYLYKARVRMQIHYDDDDGLHLSREYEVKRGWMVRGNEANVLEVAIKFFGPSFLSWTCLPNAST